MWTCKHCNFQFSFSRTTDKANHSRHCKKNPKKQESYESVSLFNKQMADQKFGSIQTYSVECYCCKIIFSVTEREKLFPSREKYFCSRSCANSIGGNAKVKKYGLTQYMSIAKKYYNEECAVCGITDVLDVHHIDEDRSNIHPSNLIFLCPNDHSRLHRNKDENVIKIIKGHGTAWGGHFICNEALSGVRIPDAPPKYFRK